MVAAQSRRRDLTELGIGYALILLVIWTPRPAQRWLYLAALAWIVFSSVRSFPGWSALGMRVKGLWPSLWVVVAAVAAAVAAVTVAGQQHTLRMPHTLAQWGAMFGGYAIWAMVQEYLLQGYFLLRLLRLLPKARWAALAATGMFTLAHLPNPVLTGVTLVWGLVACTVFVRFRNLYPLAVAHAILGITVSITIPQAALHHMRVGLGYYRYRPPAALQRSQSDQTVSTVAWVTAEAATRRSALQARP